MQHQHATPRISNSDLLAYGSILGGLVVYIFWLLRVRLVFAQYATSLPIDSALLPAQSLYWIAFILILIPFTILTLPRRVRITSLVVMLALILFAYPLQSPFGIPVGRDPQYALQAAEITYQNGFWDAAGIGTGQARGYLNFPGLPVYHILFGSLTGVGMQSAVMWGIALFRFALLPLLMFLFFRKIFKSVDLGLLAVFVYFTNPSLTNHPHYEGMAIVFLFGAVYLLYLASQRRASFALAIILIVAMVITHHFTSYVAWLWFAALIAGAIALNAARKLFLGDKVPFAVLNAPAPVQRPLVLFVILTIVLGVWSATFGHDEFRYYAGGLEDTIIQKLTPAQSLEATTTLTFQPQTAYALGSTTKPGGLTISETEPVGVSFALYDEGPASAQQNVEPSTARNPIEESIATVKLILTSGNFKPIEFVVVFVGALTLLTLTAVGFFMRVREASFMEIANLLFYGGMVLAGFLLVVIARFNIIGRMFEFTHLGVVTFMTVALAGVLHKNTPWRQAALTCIALILFATGSLLVVSGQERALYVPDEKATLESSTMFLSPAAREMALWTRERYAGAEVAGESFIFDSIGAYGHVDVHIYEPQLIRGLYESTELTDRTRLLLGWDKINIIYTNKYLTRHPGGAGGPYPPEAIRKFNTETFLTKMYDAHTIQAYFIEEGIQ